MDNALPLFLLMAVFCHADLPLPSPLFAQCTPLRYVWPLSVRLLFPFPFRILD